MPKPVATNAKTVALPHSLNSMGVQCQLVVGCAKNSELINEMTTPKTIRISKIWRGINDKANAIIAKPTNRICELKPSPTATDAAIPKWAKIAPAKKGINTTASHPTIRHFCEASASRVKLDNAFKAVVFERFASAISR